MRVPTDYKSRSLSEDFQNNLNKVGYRTLGFTEPERMDGFKPYDKAFRKKIH